MAGMSKTGIPYAKFAWNPAPGCTKGCDGCWARQFAHRAKCPLCREFVPHLHEERLGQPADTKKPGVVAVNFMGELFDPTNAMFQHWDAARLAATEAPWHDYLWLTQQPKRMFDAVTVTMRAGVGAEQITNWHFGVTVRTQRELNMVIDARLWFPCPLWLSIEPIRDWVSLRDLLRGGRISGVVVGCDRDKRQSWDNDWADAIVQECQRDDTPVYVKQLNINGKVTTNMADFPRDLRVRELAWSKPEERK